MVMQVLRQPTSLAHLSPAESESSDPRVSPVRSGAAASGTYRAVRPPTVPASVDVAELRSLLELGLWHADSERIADGIVGDAAELSSDAALIAERIVADAALLASDTALVAERVVADAAQLASGSELVAERIVADAAPLGADASEGR